MSNSGPGWPVTSSSNGKFRKCKCGAYFISDHPGELCPAHRIWFRLLVSELTALGIDLSDLPDELE